MERRRVHLMLRPRLRGDDVVILFFCGADGETERLLFLVNAIGMVDY